MYLYKGYAECYYCKDQNGPWLLENQKLICESCYEKKQKKLKNEIQNGEWEIKNENQNKRRKTNDDTRN